MRAETWSQNEAAGSGGKARGRRRGATGTALVWAGVGMALGVTLLLIVGADQDRGGPAVIDDARPLDPATYAVRVTNTCSEGLAWPTPSGPGTTKAARPGPRRWGASPTTWRPSPRRTTGAPWPQALGDGVADYAHHLQVRYDNEEAFSQAQDELVVVLEARARGLGARCIRGDGEDAEAAVHDPTPADPNELADATVLDAALGAAADDCFAGGLTACDELADSGSALVFCGVTCGGRLFHEEADDHYSCVETFAGDHPVGDQP